MRKLSTPKEICISTLRFLFENTHTHTHTHTEIDRIVFINVKCTLPSRLKS